MKRKIYTVLLSLAVITSMTAGSLSAAYALDETDGQQIEGTVSGGENGNETPSDGDGMTGNEGTSGQEDLLPVDNTAGNGTDTDADNGEEETQDPDAEPTEGEEVTEPEEPEEPERPELVFPTYTSKNVPARDMGINLRTMIGEPNAGFGVAQGAATDGEYAYFLMARSSDQRGRVVKTTLDGQLVKAGPVIRTYHGNGMTYNSKIGKLVAVGYDNTRQMLTFIDPDTLEITDQPYLKYPYKFYEPLAGDWLPESAYDSGIAAIAYIEKYNVYLARSRGYVEAVKAGSSHITHNLWVFNADTLEAIAHIDSVVAKKYPKVWQSMDGDEKYAYYLLSPGGSQPNNIVLCLDWNSENLAPILDDEGHVKNGEFIQDVWRCNDNLSGEPDAVMTMPITKESEGLFHTVSVDENGNVSNHFYVSEYKGVQKYKTVTKKEAYKVKWKKVKKKVKWKRVKIKKGKKKGKYKWKYKKKKVWVYKTKYRTYTVQEKDYKARDDYFYDLGVF